MNITIRLISKSFSRQLHTTGSKSLNACIVGSGPAGFYSAQQLLKLIPDVTIDIFEKLPVPFGLVRFGVAPDHPDVKNVINTFTKTASSPQVNFIGNVTLGQDITMSDLKAAYHIIVLTYGADHDREFGIPGESLKNVLSARRFVGWYNGLPDDSELDVNLDTETAVILGQGNVAVDIARILLSPVDILKSTDITSRALDTLSRSKVKTVFLVGRRGPLQVAFTIKEFREMLNLPGVSTLFQSGQLSGVPEAIENLPRPRKRLTQLIFDASLKTPPASVTKKFCPLFFRSPSNFEGTQSVEKVNFVVNKLEGDKAVPSSEVESIECGLALRSIGYKSVSVDPDVPFDDKTSTVKNCENVYAAGWLATGPSGVILSTMSNAFQTAQSIATDLKDMKIDIKSSKPGFPIIKEIISKNNTPVVDWDGWEKIDSAEKERGKALGKCREKILCVKEMLEIGGKIL
ncbi:unnamed protein product [Bemisia tabaci]|uniref:NADPH:adrenodoxin oxidoreductase, mitochondrial n=1 Tax=Bemisia tabaci TaxID=7038 RepID=A0A9P0A739_BEMTA|nr:unnamed protein product [Bemisia tabaci]